MRALFSRLSRPILCSALSLAMLAPACGACADASLPASPSTAFCLFEFRTSSGTRLWVNLAIVQYIEERADEIRIYYGGGNLGSGYEMRIPVRGAEEAAAFVKKMQQAAAHCAGK